MALSNMLREPRREITESLIGLSLFSIFCIPVYYLGIYMHHNDPNMPFFGAVFLSFISIAILILLFIGILLITHEIGNSICNALQRNNIHLRPKKRYN